MVTGAFLGQRLMVKGKGKYDICPDFPGRTAVRIPSSLGHPRMYPKIGCAPCPPDVSVFGLCSCFVTVLFPLSLLPFSEYFYIGAGLLSRQAACSRYFRSGTAKANVCSGQDGLRCGMRHLLCRMAVSLKNIPFMAAPPRNGCGGNTRGRRISGFYCRS